jgi:hypothetical protein
MSGEAERYELQEIHQRLRHHAEACEQELQLFVATLGELPPELASIIEAVKAATERQVLAELQRFEAESGL